MSVFPSPEVLVVGDVNPDLVLRGDVIPRFGQAEQLLDDAELVLGGSAAIVACGLASLGVAVALVAAVGDDVYGRFVTERLDAAGVDTRWLQPQPKGSTGLSVILSNPQDRAVLTHVGCMDTLRIDDLDPELLASVRHVHAASYFLLPTAATQLPALFGYAQERGTTTSLDTNWDPAQRWSGFADVLAHTDVLLPNTAELLALTGVEHLDEAAAEMTGRGVTVALKNGAYGGRVWTPSGIDIKQPAIPTTVVDTTGAGDTFNAAYLAALVDGQEAGTCLAWAVAAGGLSTRAAGGTSAQPSREELLRTVSATPGSP